MSNREQLLKRAQLIQKAKEIRDRIESQIQEPSSFNVNMYSEDSPISFWDRLIIKNTATSPESAKAYIEKKYPNLEVGIYDGEVVTRRKGEKTYSAADPKSFSLKELAKDAADSGYDILSGAIQNLAATAAGIQGGLSTGGVGTLPAAAAASALSGGALEGLKQDIGSALGVPNNYSKENVNYATEIGGVAPFVFGVDRIPENIKQSGRGLIKRGIDFIGPNAVEFATGISPDIQQAYKQYGKEVKSLASSNQPNSIIYDTTEKIQKALGEQQRKLGQKVGSAIDAASGPINILGAKSPFLERLKFLRSKPYITNAEQAEINSLQGYYNKYFGLAEPYTTFKTQGEEIFPGVVNERGITPFASQASEEAANKPWLYGNNGIKGQQLPSTIINQQSGAKAGAQQFSSQASEPFFNTAKQTFTELPDEIAAQRAFDLQQKLNRAAGWETNMTPETLSAKGSARQAYFNINENLDKAASGLSQEAKDAYANFKAVQRDLTNKFSTPQQTYNTFIGLDKGNKRITLDRLQQLAGQGVLDISPEVNQIRALNAFYDLPADPYFTPTAKPKNTGLQAAMAALGSLAGYSAGGGYAGAAVGGIAAQQAAKAAGTKAAARAYMGLGSSIDRLANTPWLQKPVFNPTNPAANPWFWYPNQQEQQP